MSGPEPYWTDAVSAIAAVLTPLVVAALGFVFNRRLKRVEDQEWRGRALIEARLGYYRELAGPLNDLMCFFTFIGTWKESTPPQIIQIKRDLDRKFHTLVPFFSPGAAKAYSTFMDDCFETFGAWGDNARLKTGFGVRRSALGESWDDAWNSMFTLGGGEPISKGQLEQIRNDYNDLLAQLVDDIQLTDARPGYTSARVVLNAH